MGNKAEISKEKLKIEHLRTVTSTNTVLKERIRHGELDSFAALSADEQTEGRGRRGRTWLNTEGALLISFAIPVNDIDPDRIPLVSIAAAIAALDAVKSQGVDASIKWPNDIVINGKKVCGMLAECGFDESALAFAAMGIGINLTADTLPEELIYASGIKEETGRELAADAFFGTFLPLFDEYIARFEKNGLSSLLGELSENMITLNRQVRVGGREGFAEGLDESGALIVSYSDGSREKLLAGDVSVRGITDYV